MVKKGAAKARSRWGGGGGGWIANVKGWQRLDLTGKGAAEVGSFGEGRQRLDCTCGWPGLDCEMTRVRGCSRGRDGVGKDGGMNGVGVDFFFHHF
ncbi:hypothetical protein TIFTF001_035538 [Ficus carica]|uniref:Uncharacterized protein n=1 Tax=Ficus carica TaxID=3494 RepID=A0AA88JA89_FICCA|nr:hypothetical protein TIFTF001_035508 [Ficus carica]GMN66456.1 hypothetical protein TIFTF001_035520 [Ficus carica]GMN66457.1 hypothetical protein TIFTF001_035526 [Ficus carica]GMN66474.1 hypothetical protein TIFTF001_035538 [Ficus carica]